MVDMKKFVDASYIKGKMFPIEQLVRLVNDTCDDKSKSNNLANELTEINRLDIAFAFAVIAKEMGVTIPDV